MTPTVEPPLPLLAVFPPGAAVEVAVRDLNLRKGPSTSADQLDTLTRGDVLIISPVDGLSLGFGPVQSDGYHWYPIFRAKVSGGAQKLDPLPTFPIPDDAAGGWVASDDGSQSYLKAVPPRCPSTIDLRNVSGMLPAERLACFKGPIVLKGTLGCPFCEAYPPTGVSKPAWLAVQVELNFLSIKPELRVGPMALRFPPDGPDRPPNGHLVRVTVHVDDRRSTRCTITASVGEEVVPVDPRTAVLYCRERVVVDAIVDLGPDPDFPRG